MHSYLALIDSGILNLQDSNIFNEQLTGNMHIEADNKFEKCRCKSGNSLFFLP